ncbi:SIR2 family protein [Flavobacterium gawalongense]|uniref:SIR2 family protein n=1 Tax=Flavobacterium gawalongense TaxID=2594432 RepID=A0A553BW73_9FLAO|nr:SIR2 family protein [Flavobacterium gawalongense]TRX12527.1 SIR2 family protein [Flavobacterium gawalongense]TRX12652.1 SIR2 family protein [Flavobacterium gawalongense]TRX30559.1 SIR2 family protein [Flavobacterium gawalongense]
MENTEAKEGLEKIDNAEVTVDLQVTSNAKNEVIDKWNYLLINGKYKTVEVQNPNFEKGVLNSIKDLRPFNKKGEDEKPITPTVQDALNLKRDIYTSFFRKPFKNFLILTGAGASMDVKGPSMKELWDIANKKYLITDLLDGNTEENGFEIICGKVKHNYTDTNLETLLSKIEGTIHFNDDIEIELDKKKVKLSDIKKELFDIIKNKCSIPCPEEAEKFPHKVLLEKLLQRKVTSPRIKVFTLNYDLLFEYASEKINAIMIDGFSFTFPRTFSGRYFDYDIVQRENSKVQEEDNFIQRVFHLHKLHGSVNWERNGDKTIIKENAVKPLMVYPREAKYEDSYDQPFFEMMARFQRNLRINNDTLLLCIGYSFNDKHINSAIEEALNQNPSFRLAIIDPGFDNKNIATSLQEIKRLALQTERILLVSETFSDFADYFPEIGTYENNDLPTINLRNERTKD